MANTSGSGRHDGNDANVCVAGTAKKRPKAIYEETSKATVEVKAVDISFVFHRCIHLPPVWNFNRHANIAS
jgi:hypothetical protein